MSNIPSPRYRDLLNRLSGVRVSGNGHIAKCPAHEDTHPSLSLREDNDHILVFCHAGCKTENVLAAIGLDFSAVDPPEHATPWAGTSPAPTLEMVDVYGYRDENRQPLYQVVRFTPKTFRPRRMGEDGQWIWNLQGVRRVLYHLPQACEAVADRRAIFITEGEKAVKALEALGLTATCSPGGAGKWREAYNGSLRGADVIILPDNDAPGRAHGEQVATSLSGTAKRVRVLNLPGLPEKGDVVDWLAAGNGPEELVALADACGDWQPNHTHESWESYNQENPDSDSINPPDTLLSAPLSDAGNAERLIARHGPDLRWDIHRGAWREWDGVRWHIAEKGEAVQRAIETVRAMIAPADAMVERALGDALIKHARRSESEGRLKSMLTLAQALDGVSVAGTAFDIDPWLLNTPSGTIDLKTGRLRKHNRCDMLAKVTAVPYDADATCPRWEQFLREIFADDEALIGYLQRLVGYFLTGNTTEQALFMLTGKGSNGKTLLLELVREMMGEYCRAAPFDTLLERRDTASYDLAGLVGSRLVTATEGAGGRAFNEPRIKQLSGGDPVSCRFLYRDFFEYTPTFKLAIATNEAPRLSSQDYSLKRRLQVVPFGVTFYTPEDGRTPVRDPLLREKLKAELPGILAWAVRGCLRWQAVGLQPPACIGRERDALFDAFDIIGEFLDTQCVFDVPAETPSAEMWKAYLAWCENTGQPPAWKSARGLTNALKQRDGVSTRKGTGGVRLVLGIKLK